MTSFRSITAAALLLVLGTPLAARAQGLPSATLQEILVKTTLLTFNDANLTGDYAVLRARLSKPFRDQFPVEKLKAIFKDFADKEIAIDPIAALPPVTTDAANIDDNGILTLTGYFDTKPKQVKYRLRYIPSDGSWRAIGIKVDVD